MKSHKSKLQPGMKVKTHRNEIGLIDKECTRPEWDWWIKIKFTAKGKDFECLEPYTKEELEIVDKNDNF